MAIRKKKAAAKKKAVAPNPKPAPAPEKTNAEACATILARMDRVPSADKFAESIYLGSAMPYLDKAGVVPATNGYGLSLDIHVREALEAALESAD